MKTVIYIFTFLITFSGFSQNNPINFETGGFGDTWTWTVFENDSNPPLEIIANPDPSGINTSPTVAKFTALQAGQPFAGVETMHGADIGTFTLDASNALVKIMVWKTVVSDVGIKFATAPGASTGEFKVANTLVNQWEELVFDFSSKIGEVESTDIDQLVIFPDFIARPADDIIYFDNITFGPVPPPTVELPIDFEGALPTFGDFNGSMTQVIANPDPTGINTSANVAENIIPANAAFAGTNFAVPVDITDNKEFTMNVWSPLANLPVLLKLENSSTGVNVERQAVLTTTNAWEEISFDFGTEGALTFDSVTVFMNFNMVDANQQTYYWDNLVQVEPMVTPVELPVTFEDTTANYDIIGFEGADSAVEANPDMSGINTSGTVVRTTKTVGAQFFAGTVLALDVPIDFAASEMISIKTWSPKADIPVRLKLENADGSQFVELDVNTTVENQWETLTWDFTGTTAGIDFTKVIVFFEFIVDLAGDGSTYYFDDIMVAEPIAGINDNDLLQIISYPNPVATEWNLSSEQLINEIIIYNVLGEEILSTQPNSTSLTMNLSELASGMYIVKVSSNEGTSTTRILKQ